VYIPGYDGGVSADCFIDLFPVDLLGVAPLPMLANAQNAST
jgi:hypothetical protein